MRKTSLAIAVAMASLRCWEVTSISSSLYAAPSYPLSSGKTGIAAARRAAKKRRRAR